MTNSPPPGGAIARSPGNSTALDRACGLRVGSGWALAALAAAVLSAAGFLTLLQRLDGAAPGSIHGKVRHETLVEPR
jgi:hypothetical protein